MPEYGSGFSTPTTSPAMTVGLSGTSGGAVTFRRDGDPAPARRRVAPDLVWPGAAAGTAGRRTEAAPGRRRRRCGVPPDAARAAAARGALVGRAAGDDQGPVGRAARGGGRLPPRPEHDR